MKQPPSQYSRYAYGFSDKKPGRTYWLVWAALALGAALSLPAVMHGAPRPSCEARIRDQFTRLMPDPEPAPQDPRMSDPSWSAYDPDLQASFLADYQRKLAVYSPYGARDYQVGVEINQRCKGIDEGLDRPMDRTITITGHVYFDGSVDLEAR